MTTAPRTVTPNPAGPYPLPVELAVCVPLGVLANIFAANDSHQNCLERGRGELADLATKISGGLDQAKGTGQLAIVFGVPMLRRRVEAKLAETRAAKVADARRASRAASAPRSGTSAAAPADEVPVTSAPAPTRLGERHEGAARHDNAIDPLVPVVAVVAVGSVGSAGNVAVDAGALAIPGYDTLSASQVVERLVGLGPTERTAVRDYESAHRGRRTILGKIDQLQSAG